MASELKNALDQLKTDVAGITNVKEAHLGQPLDSINAATAQKCVAYVYMMGGRAENDALTSTSESHLLEMSFYWLLTAPNVELVEQSMATFWDQLLTEFFGSDADRNLTEKCTLFLVGNVEGTSTYVCGFERIGNRVFRVMKVPGELILHTHKV